VCNKKQRLNAKACNWLLTYVLSFVNVQLSVSLSYLLTYSLVEIPNNIMAPAAVPGVSRSTQNDDDVTITAAVISVPLALSIIFVVGLFIYSKLQSRRG